VRTLGCDKHAGDDHVADAFDPTVDCSVSEHAHSVVAQLSATKETFEGARGIKNHISKTHRSFKPQMKRAPPIEGGQFMLRITGVTCPRDKCYPGERGAASERQRAVLRKLYAVF